MLFTWNDKLNEGTIENIVFKDKPKLSFEYIWFHCDWISFQIIEKNIKENSESYLDKFNNSFKNKPKICSLEQKEEILEVYKEYYNRYIKTQENTPKKKSSKNTRKSKEINYLGV